MKNEEKGRIVLNGASRSLVISKKGRDDARQNPKKRGTSKDVVASLDQRVTGVETSMTELKTQVKGLEGLESDFTSIREDFRVALNTLSDDLKLEIHDLRDLFMGEISKIGEEFGEEVSTLHQVIEDMKADMALCKRSLASGGGNTNHGLKLDVPKPSSFVRKREARAVDDFLWEMEQYWEGVNVQGTTTIDTWAEFVATFGVKVRAFVDFGATHNFVVENEAKQLGINTMKGNRTIKAVNSEAKPINGVSKDVREKIGELKGTINLSVVSMDDFKVVLGLEFLDLVRAFPMPFANSLCILDGGKTCMVSMKRDAKIGAKTLLAMEFKKGFNKSEPCYLAMTRLETDEGSSKVEVPKVIERVLDEFKDVMPKELP
nr:Gag-Asp_proteas domain-containing protein [Tanacetum cinerariifolium]